MGAPAEHINPFDAFFCQLEARIIAAIDERLARPPAPELPALGVDPLKVLSAKEVAQMLGTNRVSSVYEIPEDLLPRVRRIGTSVGFYLINVLAYMNGLAPVDVAGAVEAYRERLMQDRPNVVPLRPTEGGKTRVL